ncbi:MAG: S8/S53 family peptidase [Ignavibacteria bacterium]|nr:S8/S53 family peptidase [Ignavibacteria bacterium]
MKFRIISLIVSLMIIFSLVLCSCSLFKKNSFGKIEARQSDESKIVNSSKFGKYFINEIIVLLNDEYDRKEAEKIAEGVNGKIVGELEFINMYQIELSSSDEEGLLKALKYARDLKSTYYVLRNPVNEPRGNINVSCNPFDDDTYRGTNGFSNRMLGTKEAWDIIKASGVELNKVDVGVIDEPINIFNTELQGEAKINILDEEDEDNPEMKIMRSKKKRFKETGMTDQDVEFYNQINSHGNYVTNIIAANSKNGGVAGIASILGDKLNINVNDYAYLGDKDKERFKADPQYQIVDEGGKSNLFYEMCNMLRQVEKGSKIINCSFGAKMQNTDDKEVNTEMKRRSKAMKKFLEKMNKEHPDVIFVSAAGNDNVGTNGENDYWGHKLPNLITVGALNSNGDRADYSVYSVGDGEVTISAFDNAVISKGTVEVGTSFTAPQVSGVITLMKSINPDLTALEIKDIIKKTSSKTFNGKEIPANLGGGFVRADDAVLEVINQLRKKENKTPLKKEDLLSMGNVEVNSSGGPRDFTITASIKLASEKGTPLEIDISGSNYIFSGDRVKTLVSPGNVSWDLTLSNSDTKVVVKVTRLDTKSCTTILVGGELTAKDLEGEWEGKTSYDSWSTPYEMAKKEIQKRLLAGPGEELPLHISVKYVSENALLFDMQVKGGLPMPKMPFTFSQGKLSAEFVHNMVAYNYSANIFEEEGSIKLSGVWNSRATNGSMNMNGKWRATLQKK